MATYPDDATAPVTAFSVIASSTFTNTGVITQFNLPSAVDGRGSIAAFADGILQSTSSYELSNSGQTVTFLAAPSSSNLTLQTISLPSRFRVLRSFPAVSAVEYSNSSVTVVNGNNYSINGNTESFALSADANVNQTTDFMVYLSGVFQEPSAFTYPSTLLGFNGIDIGDNNQTKLLTNFSSNLTDSSPQAHTVTLSSGSPSYSASNITLPGSTYLSIASSSDFDTDRESHFTFDTIITPDAGATLSSNQTLLSRYENNSNYYYLRTVGTNSNIAFVVNDSGNITELQGGNCNGGISYHVAVSYSKTTQTLGLYVNNIRVASSSFIPSTTATGPLTIGAANNASGAGQQPYKGKIEFVRMAKSCRYEGAGLQPQKQLVPTVISGSPLGAIDKEDKLSIRIFDSSVTENDRFNSMVDRKPDRGIESERKFDVIKFESSAGYEKRRLKSRRAKRNYTLTYTNVTGIEKTAIESFYNQRSGEFESFIFDLSHINESGTITTRFDGTLKINQILSSGTSLIDNYYTIDFKLQEVYD